MEYHLDAQKTDLQSLQDRLQSTDLIPSQEPLLDGLAAKMSALSKAGIQTLGDLVAALKSGKSLASLSEKSGVDAGYLDLLRRAVNGFFPKPKSLKEIDWLDGRIVDGLAKAGLKNTKLIFEAATDGGTGLTAQTGLAKKDLREVIAVSDLCRIQWVSPSFARVLVAAGAANAAAVASSDPETLAEAVEKANANAKYYKGKVGLRDIRRLVAAARYVP